MTEERASTRLRDALEALSKASVAEVLREVGASLGKLGEGAHLSPIQERQSERAARQQLNAAVVRWIGEVMEAEGSRISRRDGNAAPRCSGCPNCPGRMSDHIGTMLDIYDLDFGQREFTPVQWHFLIVAAHNLMAISTEIMRPAR
jgi:hypothetical protein